MNNLYLYWRNQSKCCIIAVWLILFIAGMWSTANAVSHTDFPTMGTALNNTRIRSGPSTTYEQVGSLRAGTTVQIITCNATCDWYQLSEGRWIAGFLIQLNIQSKPSVANPVNLPLPTSLPTLYQVVVAQDANLRSGPGVNFSILGIALGGQMINVSGQSPDSRWLQLDNGAWIAVSLIQRTMTATVIAPSQQRPAVAPTSSAPCACDRDRYNCNDFASLEQAQRCANYCASQNLGDVHTMDLNQNGLVCENIWPQITVSPISPAQAPAALSQSTPIPTRIPTLVPTATRIPPTPMPPTATPIPPTATPTYTYTPIPPTATQIPPTPIPPTATPTYTYTPIPPTATQIPPTPIPPTAMPTYTYTPIPPTATQIPPTPIPPTATPTYTYTPIPPTQIPPTATPTYTRVPTLMPPTATAIPPLPTATSQPVDTPVSSFASGSASSISSNSSFASGSASVLSCICSADIYDCSDFTDSASATACFSYCSSVGVGDIHQLDDNQNGIACEPTELASPSATPLPPSPTPPPSPQPPSGFSGEATNRVLRLLELPDVIVPTGPLQP